MKSSQTTLWNLAIRGRSQLVCQRMVDRCRCHIRRFQFIEVIASARFALSSMIKSPELNIHLQPKGAQDALTNCRSILANGLQYLAVPSAYSITLRTDVVYITRKVLEEVTRIQFSSIVDFKMQALPLGYSSASGRMNAKTG